MVKRSLGTKVAFVAGVGAVILVFWALVNVMTLKRFSPASRSGKALMEITSLSSALGLYAQDEEEYPGSKLERDPKRNDFPLLFNALFGERKPAGPGGRCAPYAKLDEKRVVVHNREAGEYDRATPAQIRDPKVDKYLLDPWARPYVYHARTTLKDADSRQLEIEIYSLGPNGVDDTSDGKMENDDLGNWAMHTLREG